MSKKIAPLIIVALIAAGAYFYFTFFRRDSPRTTQVMQWIRDSTGQRNLMMTTGARCNDAPFAFPTNGLVGYIWDDYFNNHRHQGIDIFAGTDVGVTSVFTAYAGYLTRLADWKSSVIVRIPSDPLQTGRQIWVYYTHMADADGNSFISDEFPVGAFEVYVAAGTFLGYQGNYSGQPGNPVGVHLHVSVVKDDGAGNFLNELDIDNTYDPSPYFGLPLNANENVDAIPVCE